MELEKELVESILNKKDSELLEMLFEFGKWNEDVAKLVKDELRLRNKFPLDYEEKLLSLAKEEQIILEKGKPASILGVIVSCISVFGLLGIYMGYNYAFSKEKSKYSKDEYYKYNEVSRLFGKYVFFISISFFAIVIFSKMVNY